MKSPVKAAKLDRWSRLFIIIFNVSSGILFVKLRLQSSGVVPKFFATLQRSSQRDSRGVMPEAHLHRALAIIESKDPSQTAEIINNLKEYVSIYQREHGGDHGIFTLALLDGLRSEADANGDRLITAGELFNYVRDRVRVETAFHQNPRVLPGLSADLALAYLPGK